jgi:N utilization substance protein A
MELSKKIIDAIMQIAHERNIPADVAVSSLKDAIVAAYTKEYDGANIEVNINIDSGKIDIERIYKVVEDSFEDNDDFDDYVEITLSQAQSIDSSASTGSSIRKAIEFDKLPQAIVSHIAQIFKHNISSESNNRNYDA